MELIKSRIDKTGRLVIPSQYRKALHLTAGQEVMLRLEDGEMHVCLFKQAAERARELILSYNTDNNDLLDMLVQQRRDDIKKETHHDA